MLLQNFLYVVLLSLQDSKLVLQKFDRIILVLLLLVGFFMDQDLILLRLLRNELLDLLDLILNAVVFTRILLLLPHNENFGEQLLVVSLIFGEIKLPFKDHVDPLLVVVGVRKLGDGTVRVRNNSDHEVYEDHEGYEGLNHENEEGESYYGQRVQIYFFFGVLVICCPVVKALKEVNDSKVAQGRPVC